MIADIEVNIRVTKIKMFRYGEIDESLKDKPRYGYDSEDQYV